MTKHTLLKNVFGYDIFRNGQEEIIDCIMKGQDALGIMPTGGGKSLCYQIPALMLPGITLVVSPLVSLMKDQVNALTQAGVAAAYLNSSLTERQYWLALSYAKQGKYKIIYIAPERLRAPSFLEFAENAEISMVTVDEAHCLSQWGQDFRPDYLEIPEFVKKLVRRPVVTAFTATATDKVKNDITQLLEQQNPHVFVAGFDRPNLYFGVVNGSAKNTELLHIVEQRKQMAGIVYCATRKKVEEVCALLTSKGYCATRYHAGLEDAEKNANQDDFLYDRKRVMVATNAFGMGIDKSNVAYVVHYNMPKNMESYYQEAGRAGRDGEAAECILLFSEQDVAIQRYLINQNKDYHSALTEEEQEFLRENEFALLRKMRWYATSTDCLRNYILRYFGEASAGYCGNCSSCLSNYVSVDIAVEARQVAVCVYQIEQRGISYGRNMLADILRGKISAQKATADFENLSSFGVAKGVSAKKLLYIIDFLITQRYLDVTDGTYPVIKSNDKTQELLHHEYVMQMKLPKDSTKQIQGKQGEQVQNLELFEELKKLRAALAKRQSVPAFVIFTDATLRDMCEKMPQSEYAFLQVSGVGAKKMQQYGQQFMQVIREHTS